ncbi:hypothetical protein ES288_D01G264300v1 [Gossypium darwinii]|uniref:Uncharacterized protein n=1 Tax=Gossypium darwinii TaxID=34276 RepID=A0A5D2DUG4_GOSDA|nr:hypothetical protein ES288_D01G264300v1 [Gossypium darwinii]
MRGEKNVRYLAYGFGDFEPFNWLFNGRWICNSFGNPREMEQSNQVDSRIAADIPRGFRPVTLLSVESLVGLLCCHPFLYKTPLKQHCSGCSSRIPTSYLALVGLFS